MRYERTSILFITFVTAFLLILITSNSHAQNNSDCSCRYTTGLFAENSAGEEMPTRELPLMYSGYKSERKAILISLLGTAIPTAASVYFLSHHDVTKTYPNEALRYTIREPRNETIGGILLFTGLYIGPSVGHFYAERPLRGFSGLGLRTGITLATISGAWAVCPWNCYKYDDGYDLAMGILITGSILFTGSVVYDIVTADNSVRKHNADLAHKLSIQPTYAVKENRIGLSVKLLFW